MHKTVKCIALILMIIAACPLSLHASPREARAARAAAKKINARGLKAVCPKTRSLFGSEIYKSIASHHITDARRSSTSYITKAGTFTPSSSCLSAYDKKGNLVHKLGIYQRGNGWGGRFYGGFGCGDHKTAASVAAAARRNTGSSSIYIKVSGNTCAVVPNANACYNSIGC